MPQKEQPTRFIGFSSKNVLLVSTSRSTYVYHSSWQRPAGFDRFDRVSLPRFLVSIMRDFVFTIKKSRYSRPLGDTLCRTDDAIERSEA